VGFLLDEFETTSALKPAECRRGELALEKVVRKKYER